MNKPLFDLVCSIEDIKIDDAEIRIAELLQESPSYLPSSVSSIWDSLKEESKLVAFCISREFGAFYDGIEV